MSRPLDALSDLVFAAVIFDMDGTLIDSIPAMVRAWTRWAGEFGVTAEQLAGYHGVPVAGVVRAVVPAHRYDRAIARIVELELSDIEGLVVLPGAREALADLADAPSAIATSSTRQLAAARLAAARLAPPTVLVTADDIARGKPAPDPFLEAARRLGVDPGSCLVVEDAPQGLVAARAAGCHTLGLTTTTQAASMDADLVIPDLGSVRFVPSPDGIQVRRSGQAG